jgi:hypothetical protein
MTENGTRFEAVQGVDGCIDASGVEITLDVLSNQIGAMKKRHTGGRVDTAILALNDGCALPMMVGCSGCSKGEPVRLAIGMAAPSTSSATLCCVRSGSYAAKSTRRRRTGRTSPVRQSSPE